MGFKFSCMLLALASLLAVSVQAQNGEEIFIQRCAVCHLEPDHEANAHTPSREDIALFTPNSVYAALTDGLMRQQASGLTEADKKGLAQWLTGREVSDVDLSVSSNLCAVNDTLQNPAKYPLWNGWGPDNHNTRYALNGGVSAADLPQLKLRWAYGLPGESQPRAQPAIFAGRLFVGNRAGAVHALDAKTGCTYWTFLPKAGVRSALSVTPFKQVGSSATYAVVFIDMLANVYAIDAQTGSLLWQHRVDDHPSVRGTGAVTIHEGRVYVPLTGVNEENTASNPDYSCCTFRGSITALDVNSGEQVWKFYTVPEPTLRGTSSTGAKLYGPAGVGIWSAPTVDAQRGLIYAATGNAYADPVPATADSVIAVSMQSGELVWTQQLTPLDAWIGGCTATTENPNCPETVGPDFDFSASPILTHTSEGKDILVIPQKSGMAYGLDPAANGALLWQYRAGPGSAVGGVWGAAVAGDSAYVAVGGYFSEGSGGIHAIDIRSGERLWYTPPQALLCEAGPGCGPTQSAAVTAIPGAVFSGSQDGGMRAYDQKTGEVLWTFNANTSFATVNELEATGGSFDGSGPVVAGGMVYILSGNAGFVGRTGNVLLAFSLQKDDE